MYRQVIDASRRAGLSEKSAKQIIDASGKIIEKLDLSVTPPEAAGRLNRLVITAAENADLYRNEKKKSNDLALSVYNACKNRIEKAEDPLRAAVELSIAGNIIDYGVKNTLDVEEELERIMKEENALLKNSNMEFFAYPAFSANLKESKEILYLADNAGEIVFDRILIETIRNMYPHTHFTFAVKSTPILNDALIEDAVYCGLESCTAIIASGSEIPGTVLSLCSREFLECCRNADMIISKGQGNYESFESPQKDVFYLFMAKCPIVARQAGCEIRAINLLYLPGTK